MLEEGQSLDFRFNGFQALNDDYENYEMKFFKDWHEKRTNAGVQAWWEFNKVINRSKNANQEVTHFTLDILKDGLNMNIQKLIIYSSNVSKKWCCIKKKNYW